MSITFEWDRSKASINMRKHGVSFEEAASVFADRFSLTIADREHSDLEERWLTLGQSSKERLVVVWHTDRQGIIRIVGARPANRRERRTYQEE